MSGAYDDYLVCPTIPPKCREKFGENIRISVHLAKSGKCCLNICKIMRTPAEFSIQFVLPFLPASAGSSYEEESSDPGERTNAGCRAR